MDPGPLAAAARHSQNQPEYISLPGAATPQWAAVAAAWDVSAVGHVTPVRSAAFFEHFQDW